MNDKKSFFVSLVTISVLFTQALSQTGIHIETTVYASANDEITEGKIYDRVKEVDSRITLTGSDNSVVFTLDITDSRENTEDEVRSFFWDAANILNSLPLTNEFSQMYISFFLKRERDVYGFTVTQYKDPWDFYTEIITLSKDDIGTSLGALFEHAYYSTFGGFDLHNNLDSVVSDYLKGKVSDYEPLDSFQRGVFWAYTSFSNIRRILYSERSMILSFFIEDTEQAGLEAREDLVVANSFYGVNKRYAEECMPYDSLTFMYYTQDSREPILTCKIDPSQDEWIPDVRNDDTAFAKGFME